jgi:sugar lactone lactonase YvrE
MSRVAIRSLVLPSALGRAAFASGVETVVAFDPAAFEAPESIQFDRAGNAYVSLALTGEVRRIAPDGAQQALAWLPLRPDVQPCANALGFAILGGLALDHQRNVYVSVNSCNPPDHASGR